LNCPQCPSGAGILKRKNGYLKIDDFKKVIDELKGSLVEVLLYFQGEPFLNSDIFSMINYAKKKKIYTTINTNGNFTNPEKIAEEIVKSGLEKVIISLDGVTEETYNKYRKDGDLNLVLEGIQNIIREKKKNRQKKPKVILQFLLMKHNEMEIRKFKRLVRELECDGYIIKTVQVYPGLNNEEFLPSRIEYRRYSTIYGDINYNTNIKNRCKRLWAAMVITWDGIFVPCCFDKDAHFNLGNAFRDGDSLIVWKAEESRRFRNSVLKNQAKIDICNNCIETLERPHIIEMG